MRVHRQNQAASVHPFLLKETNKIGYFDKLNRIYKYCCGVKIPPYTTGVRGSGIK
jgi:hypothetical protein